MKTPFGNTLPDEHAKITIALDVNGKYTKIVSDSADFQADATLEEVRDWLERTARSQANPLLAILRAAGAERDLDDCGVTLAD